MITHLALIAALLQGTPETGPSAAKATISGVVVHRVTREPVANVRVSIARLGVSLGPFAQMVAGQGPSIEVTFPAEFFAAAREELAGEVRDTANPDDAARASAIAAVPVEELHEVILGPAGTAVVLKSTPPIMTDALGRFAFDVEPGSYRLIFAGAGYARTDYGQRTIGGGGVQFILKSGERKTDIVMPLAPVGAISGHIRDATGQPIAAIPIQLFRFVYDEAGQRRVQRIAATRSDDRGEYRMYYLSPGRYYLSAGNLPGRGPALVAGPRSGGGYVPASAYSPNYAFTYYPGVIDENLATPIEVQPGADLSGVDLLMRPQQLYRVSGRVIDSKTGQPPASVGLSMNAQITDANISSSGSLGSGPQPSPNYKAADGTFELPNTAPGTYTLAASLATRVATNPANFADLSRAQSDADFQAMRDADLARPKTSTTVKVVNADIDGIVLTLSTGISIPGRIRLDPSAANREVSLQYVRVQLRSPTAGPVLNMNYEPQPRLPKPDGSFVVENVLPGEYRVSVFGLPDGFYVKEARLGDADVLTARLRVIESESGVLDIVISPNVATVEGTASPGAQVVLIPRNRERTELFRPVIADSAGRFTIPAVAPGDYILAAWEALEPYAFFDRNVIEQVESGGKPVQVSESSKQSVSITPIR